MEPFQVVIDRVVQREKEIGLDVLEHERQIRAMNYAIKRGDQDSAEFYRDVTAKYRRGVRSPK